MHDRHQREINYLRISVTDRCNLRCSYCMPKEGLSLLGHDDILRYEEFLRIVRVAVTLGIIKVRITGGEPLVRRGLLDFLRHLVAIPGLQDVSLTTNGILLAEQAEGLYQAGIRRVNVSLDSLRPDRYRAITRGGDLSSVLAGIAKAREVGISPVKINTVALKGFNDDEVLDFARLTLTDPVHVRFIERMPIGAAGGDFLGTFLPNTAIRRAIQDAYPLAPVNGQGREGDGPAERYRVAGAAGEIGFISPITRHFCDQCNRLRITADGWLRACLYEDGGVPVRDPLRKGVSDEDLRRLMEEAIRRKPLGQDFLCGVRVLRKCARGMSAIGG